LKNNMTARLSTGMLGHMALSRRRFLKSMGAAALSAAALGACAVPPTARRPHLLLLIADDMRMDGLDFMPQTKARIFGEGVAFNQAYIPTPLCCPSRASLLTGQYAHHTGVRLNSDALNQPTVVQTLHENGYHTGLVGKYLNSWDGTPRPEFDWWVSFAGGKSVYTDPELNVNGAWSQQTGYMTYLLRDYALQFLDRAAQLDEPFLLIFAPNAPHHPYEPAPGDEARYTDMPFTPPPNYNELDVSDKPEWIQRLPLITEDRQAGDHEIRLRQAQMLWALDQTIAALLDRLAAQGRLDDTCVMFISDNGLFVGEHRLAGKRFAYEESSRVPLGMRYPPLIAAPHREDRLVANIDIAPTFLDLAGLPALARADGRSLVPLLRGPTTWRDDVLLQGWTDDSLGPPYQALRSGPYMYIENQGDNAELYDLEQDPYQLENQINNPAYTDLIAQLHQRLRRLVAS
jgi:N-acetylglucosamine-6-sulfatase